MTKKVEMFERAMIAIDLDSEVPLLECAPDLETWGVKRLVLVHLLKVGYAQGPSLGDDERYRRTLEARAEPLRREGFAVEVQVGTAGDVGAELAARAKAAADLLVVGKGGRRTLAMGSTARALSKRADRPVLMIPRATR